MSGEEASGSALSDADAECLSKRARTEYHLDKTGLNAGKQNANVDGQCLMNVGEIDKNTCYHTQENMLPSTE